MALGKLFEIKGTTIIPKQDCYILQPLKRVIDTYPEEFPKVIAFLHYMNSMSKEDNPYADVPLDVRPEQILYDLDLNLDLEDEVIRAVRCSVWRKNTTPRFYGLYRGFKSILDRTGLALMTEEVQFGGKDANMQNIAKFMKDYESLRKNFKQAYRDFDEESGGFRARGGGDLADDEETDY
jgi:hypothetical protein